VSLVSSDEPAEVVEPGEEPLDLPAPPVASEGTAVLGRGPRAVPPVGRDQLDASLFPEPLGQGIAVVGLVSDQAVGGHGEEAVVDRLFCERDLSWRSTRDPGGDRKASAVCNCHDLGPLPALGLSDGRAPFLAPEKVPSMKASVMSIRPRWYRSSARAWSTRSMVPLRDHCWKRR
jgi:hypothetical protein